MPLHQGRCKACVALRWRGCPYRPSSVRGHPWIVAPAARLILLTVEAEAAAAWATVRIEGSPKGPS